MALALDRKSTRLNSSHRCISYAVFCLKKKMNDGVISRMDYDRASADERQTEANVAEVRATIERKTIRAPFSGILGIRKANLGQYLPGGGPVVALQSLNPIYVNFGVPQQVAGHLLLVRRLRPRSTLFPYTTLFR